MLRPVRVLIVGGGIAGCSLWLALRQHTERALAKGHGAVFTATIYENSRSIEPVGAGIALGPNGLRVLDSLGLLDRLKVLGGELKKLHVYNDQGQHLRDLDCSFLMDRLGYPMLCMERAELQALLVHQVLRSASSLPVPVHVPSCGAVEPHNPMLFGKRCIGVQDTGHGDSGVAVKFDDGTEAVGDVVVAADGTRSAVRSAVFESTARGQEHLTPTDIALQPKYAGITSLLGVTSSVPESLSGSAYWVLGRGRMYGTWSMGRRKQYWFLTRREKVVAGRDKGEGGGLEEGRWTPAEALQGMDEMWNWFHPYDAHAMFSRTVRAVKVGFYQLPQGQQLPLVGPTVQKVGSRVVMMGDAAHAMLPTVHQGANLAVEDAAVLANVLAYRCAEPVAYAGLRESPVAVEQKMKTSSMEHPHPSANPDRSESRETEDLSDKIRLALEDYVSLRSWRVRRVMSMSRRTGAWQTSSSSPLHWLNTAAFRFLPQHFLESSLDWVYNYKVPKDWPYQ